MISRVEDSQAGRRRRFSLSGSFLVHALAIALFAILAPLFVHPEKRERASSPEVITITRRDAIPAPKPPPIPRIVPKREPVAKPAVVAHTEPLPVKPAAPARPRTEPKQAVAPVVARVVPKVVRKPVRKPRPIVPERPVALAPRQSPVTSGAATTGSTLSQTRIAQIQNDLSKAIASQKSTIDPLKVPPSTVASTMKSYGPATDAFEVGDSRTHHGLCDPVKDWTAGGYDYYYVVCNVKFSDGSMARQSVPWPVRFVPTDDPFNGTSGRDMALAMPLPGWHAESSQYISKELREYAKDHGITL